MRGGCPPLTGIHSPDSIVLPATMIAISSEFGRLEEFFSDYIYPAWPLYAIVGVLAVAGAAYLALRLGWHKVALRHPLISGVAAVAILAVSIPTGYYLASPLFERSWPARPARWPAQAQGPTSARNRLPPLRTTPAATDAPAATAAPTPEPSFEASVVQQGEFHGADDFH